jgi:hypothetical protein
MTKPWMKTYTGQKFHFLDPDPDTIRIHDIAHSLSSLCRFNGHTQRFYSVAEHSYLVATLCPIRIGLHGLLHDASEAYLSDVIAPQKDLFKGYGEMERVVQYAIYEKFKVTTDYDTVHQIDQRMCLTEGEQLMGGTEGWGINGDPFGFELNCWTPIEAENNFIDAFLRYSGKPRE